MLLLTTKSLYKIHIVWVLTHLYRTYKSCLLNIFSFTVVLCLQLTTKIKKNTFTNYVHIWLNHIDRIVFHSKCRWPFRMIHVKYSPEMSFLATKKKQSNTILNFCTKYAYKSQTSKLLSILGSSIFPITRQMLNIN